MAATEQTLLIPFQGGLDTYSNSQLLKPGFLTASTGTMLDRPGTAYPGPGYSATQWAPAATRYNHGVGGLSHGPATNADQLVFWSTLANGSGPGISPAGSSSTTPLQQRLAPWRQVTQNFTSDSLTLLSTSGGMSGPPQCAVAGGRAFYVWSCFNNTGVSMAYQDLATRAWFGPYYLISTSALWATSGSAERTVTRIAVAGDSKYFRMASLNNFDGSMAIVSWLASDPLGVPNIFTTNSYGANTYTQIDAVGTGDENGTYGVVVALDSTTNQLQAIRFSSASASPDAPANVIAGATAPITCNLIRGNSTSTGFIFGSFITSAPNAHPFIRTTDFSLSTLSSGDMALGGTTWGNMRAMTVGNTVADSSTAIAYAVEMPETTTVLGTTYSWNLIRSQAATLNNGTVNTLTSNLDIRGWGGLALMGKYQSWYTGTDFRALFSVRSGWRHTSGTWGTITTAGATFAYPNGYLYDQLGTLWAKFGDADVGTDFLWPSFAAGGYTATGLACVPNGFRYNLASGQQTLTYAWPQMGHVGFFSARTADSGSPINSRAGLATVTWLAPTMDEPAAQPIQFGTSLIIPGAITAYFDGSNLFEAGYFHRCPSPAVAANGSGGSLPTGTTYYVQAVAVYADATGRLHYSAPSLRVPVTTGAANDSINYAIPTINQTFRLHTSTPIGFQLYRSTGNPSGNDIPMYYVSTLSPVNIPDSMFSSLDNDGTADANLTQNPTIYTQSMNAAASAGTFSPPPFDSIRVWNGQVWGIANRNGPELWCSWPQDNGVLEVEGTAWSAANRVALPAEIGQPKALSDFDEKLIILGSRTDYGIIANQLLDRSTTLADTPTIFSSPIALPTPGGCKVLNSATRLPAGILFQGTQGFSLLQRDLSYAPVGTPVKDFARNNLYLPGVLLPEQPAVLLFCPQDPTKNLIYFYETGEWAQPEQPPVGDGSATAATGIIASARAVTGGSSQVYLLASTQPYYFQVEPFSKYMSYRTPWVELKDLGPRGGPSIAGQGTLWEVQLVGELPDGALRQTVTLYTEFDYANNTVQPPETQMLTLTASNDFQWRFGFAQSQARRVRFTVTVNGGVRTSAGEDNATVLLAGLMLHYIVDTGLSRLGSGSTTGS